MVPLPLLNRTLDWDRSDPVRLILYRLGLIIMGIANCAGGNRSA